MNRPKRTVLVLASLAGIALGAFAFQAASAHATPSAQDVTIINTPAQPVPVAVQGIASVAGTVSLAGTPSVNATIVSAPAVQLAPGTTVVSKEGSTPFETEVTFNTIPSPGANNGVNFFTTDPGSGTTIIRNVSAVVATNTGSTTHVVLGVRVIGDAGLGFFRDYYLRAESAGNVHGTLQTHIATLTGARDEFVVNQSCFIVVPENSRVEVLVNDDASGATFEFVNANLTGSVQ